MLLHYVPVLCCVAKSKHHLQLAIDSMSNMITIAWQFNLVFVSAEEEADL